MLIQRIVKGNKIKYKFKRETLSEWFYFAVSFNQLRGKIRLPKGFITMHDDSHYHARLYCHFLFVPILKAKLWLSQYNFGK